MKKLKVGFASFVLSTAAVAVLVQCAPKESNKDKDRGKDKAVSAGVIDGMDFSELEKVQNRPNTKALLKALKDRTEPTASLLSMALVELHLQADVKLTESAEGKTNEKTKDQTDAKAKEQADAKVKEESQAKAKEVNDKVLENWEVVSKYAGKIKAAKPEELKKVYALIAEEVKRDIRYNPSSVSILNALEKGEIEDYSGTSLLTLMWLQTGSLKRDKGVILFEENLLKIAELRGTKNNVFSINTDTKDAVSKDLGSLEDLMKAGKSKLVQLDLFVIHESLKPFVADQKAWAMAVQKASNKALGLKIEDKQLLFFDGAEKSKLNHSALLAGKPREKNTFDLQTEGTSSDPGQNGNTATSVSGDGTASNVSGDNTAGSASGDNTAGTTSGDNTGAGEPTAQGPASVMYQSVCVNMPEFRKAMTDNKLRNLLSVFSWAVDGNRKFMSQANSSLTMIRLEALDAKALATVDSDLASLVVDAIKVTEKDKKMRMILMVLPKGGGSVGSLWMFDKETDEYLKGYGTVPLKANATEYLRSKSRATEASKDTHLIVETKQEACS
ncbi:MAG: hypothetical protein ACXWC9_05825 [Pseudobdellovibrionaceae bacterium]